MRTKTVYTTIICTCLLLTNLSSVRAGENHTTVSALSNPVAGAIIVLMIALLIVIAMLGKLLLDVAAIKLKKEKEQPVSKTVAVTTATVFLLCNSSLYAQTNEAGPSDMIAGMSSFSFYTMMTIVFVELFVILALLFNIRALLKTESEKLITATEPQRLKKPVVSLWAKLNRFKTTEQEADIDLGHDYDGIRELDNRLPPWWLYGFYLTIIVAVIYLWRFHVSHTGLSGKEEYEIAVADADIKIKAYLEKKGDAVDENTVTILSSPDDIAAGKAIFLKSCAACHKESGAGDVGPNLTDNYWLHGNDIKSIFKTIRYGVNAMPQWQNSYSNKQIAQVASFVESLKGSSPANAKPPQGKLYTDGAGKEDTTANTLKATPITAQQ